MRRGDIRALLLSVLSDGPGHGYELITRLEERSGGRWRPSPGSVYPTLQLLEEGGLLSSEMIDGKKVYTLTEAGQSEVAAKAEQGFAPWGEADNQPGGELRNAMMQLGGAAWQVAQHGDASVSAAAAEAINQARRKLYELLAQT